MYSSRNFKSKKDLKTAVANFLAGTGPAVTVYSPGLGEPKQNGKEYLSGPHFPEPHKWYAEVEMKDGKIVKVK
jgi:hypothetical protein